MARADTAEVKRENFASVEEAIEGAGTTVLSHLGSWAHKLTRDEVRQYEEDNHLTGPLAPGEYRAAAGPYSEVTDERNYWTFRQETGETEPPDLPPEGESAAIFRQQGRQEGEGENEQRRREYEQRESGRRRPKAEQKPAQSE